MTKKTSEDSSDDEGMDPELAALLGGSSPSPSSDESPARAQDDDDDDDDGMDPELAALLKG